MGDFWANRATVAVLNGALFILNGSIVRTGIILRLVRVKKRGTGTVFERYWIRLETQ